MAVDSYLILFECFVFCFVAFFLLSGNGNDCKIISPNHLSPQNMCMHPRISLSTIRSRSLLLQIYVYTSIVSSICKVINKRFMEKFVWLSLHSTISSVPDHVLLLSLLINVCVCLFLLNQNKNMLMALYSLLPCPAAYGFFLFRFDRNTNYSVTYV